MATLILNEKIAKSSRKCHTQDAKNTRTPTLIIQHTYNNSQIYQTGIPFIYTVRFVGDRWDEGEVERS